MVRLTTTVIALCGFAVLTLSTVAIAVSAEENAIIVYPKDSALTEVWAAKEIRRYLYLRTNRYVSITAAERRPPQKAVLIMVGQKDRPLIRQLIENDGELRSTVASLQPQEFKLKMIRNSASPCMLIAGGDALGTLYGAYRLIEHLGVRFFLHGDVIPDKKVALEVPDVDELGRPLFELRGLNPWGSHAEGMDLWGPDEYKAIFAQMAKMRMNFVGIHCYSEGHPFAEPLVWTGIKEDFGENGNVSFGYPASYFNTLRDGCWGYRPRKTSDYSFGASLLFERDDWGPDVMLGYTPCPVTEKGYNEVFNRMGKVLNDSFGYARLLGIKTCIGTEAPLTIPARLRERLKTQEKDASDPAVVQSVYEGMFQRIMNTHPLDYYWIWTAEGWTWGGNTAKQMDSIITDIKIAMRALKNVQAPFQLATAGWVLGPKDDRAAFDKLLPKEIAVSAISRNVGHDPVDPAFGNIKARSSWAIPWLEDDPALTSPQLWVGRTRKDAADALAYGCTGLMGLHWRTRILGPNVSALAQAAWDQSKWNPARGEVQPDQSFDVSDLDGPIGGSTADYPASSIRRTRDDRLYQTCRYDIRGYRLKLSNGRYRVTLKFCEPHFNASGKRVCDVKLQGKTVIEKLDIFAEVGRFAARDYTFDDIRVMNGSLKLDFVYRQSLPCISAIVIEGKAIGGNQLANKPFTRKINCGGERYQDYEPDMTTTPRRRGKPRGLSTDDFYADWSLTMFGQEVAPQVAAIFRKIDGRLPRTSDWVGGAGGIKPDNRPWEKAAGEFAFVEDLATLRPNVKGAGNLERFDYWLNTFRYHRRQGRVRCALGAFNGAMKKLESEKDPVKRKAMALEKALPLYRVLIDSIGMAYRYQLSAVSTYGGLATIMNWEGHIGPALVDETTKRLSSALDGPVPDDALPTKKYQGTPRIIVPTVRTSLVTGESLKLKVIILDYGRPRQAALYWRTMGPNVGYRRINLSHLARGVYKVSLPPIDDDFEYHIKAVTVGGKELYFPATAPQMNQTVVVVPRIQHYGD